MHWILVILVVGLKSESLTTEKFSDLKSCQVTGKKITSWINNDERWKDSSKYKCFKSSGK